MKKNTERFWGALIFAVLLVFAVAMILRAEPLSVLRGAVEDNIFWGMVIFVLIEAASIVVVPVTTLLLIPVAADLFGALATALLSILGWGIGSVAAFAVARHFGLPAVQRLIGKERLDKYRKALGERAQFWSVVLLRALFPVDVISYALGLFSTLSLKKYILATFIGISPFAFFYAYAGQALTMGRYGTFASLAALGALALAVIYWLWRRFDTKA